MRDDETKISSTYTWWCVAAQAFQYSPIDDDTERIDDNDDDDDDDDATDDDDSDTTHHRDRCERSRRHYN